ncbi:MAG TPA: HK97 family phage prohead protease [Tepidisphaeraceae bacterium]|nr:HK97 family phage prohead protease [Tepidisphaeraceae bacterium]
MNQHDPTFETRFIRTAAGSEIRMLPGTRTLAGIAAPFNSPSEDLGGFREVIQRGAFNSTLSSNRDIRALLSHDNDKLLGRTSSGTLRLHETPDGLAFENDLPDVSYARDLMSLVQRRDIRGMSFGFRVPKGGDSWAKVNGQAVRTLKSVDLGEISYVANPAYGSTAIQVRSFNVDPETVRAARDFMAGTGTPAMDRCRRILDLMQMEMRAA